MSTPFVSICVPAHGDHEALRLLLEALQQLSYPADRREVVVAVDGPDPALEHVAAAADKLVVLATNQGSYAARNAALDATSPDAEVVLFTDSDCAPVEDWVQAHLRALDGADLSGGAVTFTHRTPPSPAEWVDMTRFLQQQHLVETVGFAATCNLAGRADVVRSVRFDGSLRSGGDLDFGHRAKLAGARLVYTPDAAVLHPARPTTRELLRKVRRVARGARVLPPSVAGATVRHSAPRRPSPRQWAEHHRVAASRLWDLRCRALARVCSLVWAVNAPNTIVERVVRRGP
ncbi:MAG: glycosyl transferase family 2 [Frankiales bacterium]|nr:glycosyl transferase family 2 [Frankiales bacterium]